jgi:hypothetical protein
MFFNSSTQATAKLRKAQRLVIEMNNEENSDGGEGGGAVNVRTVILFQDCKTRWWSTHRMVKRLLELKDAIILCFTRNCVCNVNTGLKKDSLWEITAQQWKTLEYIAKVLEPFEDGMKLLEGEKYVTASWVLIIVELIRKGLQMGVESDCVTSVRMSKILLKDFEVRWGAGGLPVFNRDVVRGFLKRQYGIHPCFVIAMCLDPRFKHLKRAGILEVELVGIWKRILELMIAQRMSGIGNGDDVGSNVAGSDDDAVPPALEVDDDELDFLTQLDRIDVVDMTNTGTNNTNNDATGIGNDAGTVVRVECEMELSLYKKATLLRVRNGTNHWTNPLEWWKINEIRFPTLAALAEKYLSVQATSASSERIFSRARRIVTPDRNRLDPHIVGCLLYVSENLIWYEKRSSELNYDEIADEFFQIHINNENEE